MGIDRNQWRRERGIPMQPGLEQLGKDKLEATKIVHEQLLEDQESVKKQLDILRKTRPTRDVGKLTIPAHLQETPASTISIDEALEVQRGGRGGD